MLLNRIAPGRFQLEGEITIYAATSLKNLLLDALKVSPTTEIDLSRVEELDTAGLQLLLLIKNEARVAGHQLRFIQHSPIVREVFDLCDLAAVFGDPIVILDPANS